MRFPARAGPRPSKNVAWGKVTTVLAAAIDGLPDTMTAPHAAHCVDRLRIQLAIVS